MMRFNAESYSIILSFFVTAERNFFVDLAAGWNEKNSAFWQLFFSSVLFRFYGTLLYRINDACVISNCGLKKRNLSNPVLTCRNHFIKYSGEISCCDTIACVCVCIVVPYAISAFISVNYWHFSHWPAPKIFVELLPFLSFFSLSLSLSHTWTHTRIRTRTHAKMITCNDDIHSSSSQ